MSDRWHGLEIERATMARAATLARLNGELDDLEALLDRLPLWEPARELRAESGWVRGQLARLAEAWDRRLVVAIVGPSGSGKSTLLNALAGRRLSATGLERPTTRQVVAFVPSDDDARWLEQLLGEQNVQVSVARDAPGLAHLILLDTPDTNTVPENQALLERTLEHVDLVLAVFDAGNPQLLDNLAFLAPAMRRLPQDAIVPVLNRVDRVTEAALDRELTPDLQTALLSEWGLQPGRVYHVSGRAALEGAGVIEDEQPLHGRNEFAELQSRVLGALNRGGEAASRRGAHAERLVSLLREDVASRIDQTGARVEAQTRLNELNARSQQAMADEVLNILDGRGSFSMAEGLYERLARQWWGPVGWLVAVWALALRLIGWLRGAAHRGGRGLSDLSRADANVGEALIAAQASLYAVSWPPLGDLLVQIGFSPQVRHAEQWRAHAEAVASAMLAGGEMAVESVLDLLARRLSLWLWQGILNLPLIGLVGWVGYRAVGGLFSESYLGGDFFQQAGIAVVVLWVAAFVILQLAVGVALRRPLRRALGRALGEAASGGRGDLLEQLDALEALAQTGRRRRGGDQ